MIKPYARVFSYSSTGEISCAASPERWVTQAQERRALESSSPLVVSSISVMAQLCIPACVIAGLISEQRFLTMAVRIPP